MWDFEKFFHWCLKSEELSPRTTEEYIKSLSRYKDKIDLDDLVKTNNTIGAMMISGNAKLMLTSALRKYLKFIGRKSEINAIDRPSIKFKGIKHWFDMKILKEMDSACKNDKERLVINLLFYTACRPRVFLQIRKGEMIDLDRKEITITGKGGKVRVVRFNDSTKKLLKKHLKRLKDDEKLFDMSYWTLRSMIKRICKRKKSLKGVLKWITPHKFRHSWGSVARSRGMSLENIQEYLGHESIETTRRFYISIPTEEQRISYEEIFG